MYIISFQIWFSCNNSIYTMAPIGDEINQRQFGTSWNNYQQYTWCRLTRFFIWPQSAIFIPILKFFVTFFSKLPNEMRHLFASRYSMMASFDIEKCTVPRPLLQPLWCMLVDSTILERIIYYLPYITQHLQK